MLFIALGLMAFIVVLMRFEPKRRKPMPADKAARLFEVKAWVAITAGVALGIALSLSAYVGPVVHETGGTVANVLTQFGTDIGRGQAPQLVKPDPDRCKTAAGKRDPKCASKPASR
jgi:hypothetical protein